MKELPSSFAAVAIASVALCAEIDLGGEWRLEGVDQSGAPVRCAAKVPGDVHSTLLKAGLMPDVYYARNEEKTLWVARQDWTFSREFDADAALLAHREIVLRLEDCDTFCTVSVNGREVGRTADRFQRYTFDVKPFLKEGKNAIAAHFESPVRKADEQRAKIGRAYPMSNVPWAKNQALIRKPAFSGGWDWGPELETMGFCGKVALIASDAPRIDYVYTDQRFTDDMSHCTLTVFADLSDGTCVTNVVEIDNPPLWWPNGAGEQRFYTFTVDVNGEKVTRRIGLRKIEVLNERSVSKNGKDELSLVFRVNNRRLFMKGANWIPCDAYESRQTPDKYRDLLVSARDANMNMIRVWGGGQYERDCFYDMCDELGILLWHDMMCSCAVYPGDDWFLDEIRAELAHQLRRLRDHASIAMWCGDNECLGAIRWFEETRKNQDFYREQWIRRSKMQGEMVAKYDPGRAYWPSSPCCGPGDFGNAWKDDSKGDMHNWNVWHENKPFEDYYNYTPRFCSEFGYQSFPSMEVASTFASVEQILSRGPDYEWHQKNPGGNRRIRESLVRYFPAAKDAPSEMLLSQFQHGMAMKMACEGWRAQRPRCMGTLFWQLNDDWPVASWSSIEYGGKWKSVQHMARRFFAPVAVVGGPDGAVKVLNDTAESVGGEVVLEYWTYGGRIAKTERFAVAAPPDSATKVGEMHDIGTDAEPVFAVMTLKTFDGAEFVNDWHFRKYVDAPLADARVDIRIIPTTERNGFKVRLSASAPAFFVWANAEGLRGEFDDNAFTLLPGRPRTLTFNAKQDIGWWEFKDRLSVVSLSDLREGFAEPLSKVKYADEIDDGRPSGRWRGFNINTLYNRDWGGPNAAYDEDDFKFISEFGFNFVRLTVDYRYWIKDGDRAHWLEFDEAGLKKIDRALELAGKYGLHAQISFYRIPGYASGGDKEPTDIFSDGETLRVACEHWKMLARRYKDVPNDKLTFNLFNEPVHMEEGRYTPVIRALVAAIREVDGKRFLISDAVDYGRIPMLSLADIKGMGQSYHSYDPHSVTHYRAPWVELGDAVPVWPPPPEAGHLGPGPRRQYDNPGMEYIYRKSLQQWNPLIDAGVFVNVGEFGVWKKTPHKVALALIEDELALFKDRNVGWAMWEFRGGFGVLDSGRDDVEYEDFHGHKLDRKLLDLLRRY